MKCKYKESCGYEFCMEDECPDFEAVAETNADHIRGMTDEELATQLVQIVKESIYAFAKVEMPDEVSSELWECLYEKLKQPAEAKNA